MNKRTETVKLSDRVSIRFELSQKENWQKSMAYMEEFFPEYIWGECNLKNLTINDRMVRLHLRAFVLLDGETLVMDTTKQTDGLFELFYHNNKFTFSLTSFKWKEAVEANLKVAKALHLPMTFEDHHYCLNGERLMSDFNYPLTANLSKMESALVWGSNYTDIPDTLSVKSLIKANIIEYREYEANMEKEEKKQEEKFKGFSFEVLNQSHTGRGEDEHYYAKVKVTGNGTSDVFEMNNWCDAGFVCNGEESDMRDFAIKNSPIPKHVFV